MAIHVLKTILSCFTSCLFIFYGVGGVHDVGGDNPIHMLRPHRCHAEERSALLEFKQGLSIVRYGFSHHETDSWKAGGDCCSGWEGVECDQVTSHVIGLDLSISGTRESYINGSISGNSTLFHLFHLQKLNLSYNELQGQIPSSIFRFTNLSSLDLGGQTCDIWGLELHRPSLEDLVHNLTELEHLHLDGVDMTGSTLPDSLSNYSCLKSISLSNCGLSGELPSGIFHLPKLLILDLSHNTRLSVHFTEFEGNSPLKELRIGSCNFSRLTSFGRLANLTYLDISSNAFLGLKSSSFSWLSNLTKLAHLDLNGMKISGEIPPQISYLTALTYLDLSHNDLSGQMTQAWLSNLTQLVHLDISHNQLTSQIPSSLSTLTQLVTLDLKHNRLTGQIPSSLSTLTRLGALWLDHNRLTGSIHSLTKLTHLQVIDLSFNRLEGTIPNSFSNLSKLVYLALHSNHLNGTVELEMFHKLGGLSTLKLSQNNLTLLVNEGIDSVVLDKYEVLGLGSCNLGKFPTFLLNQSKLQLLDLSLNNIHGMIPAWIWNHSSVMNSLNVSHNFLTTIEEHPILLPRSELRTLDISFNMLQGSLPVPSLFTHFYVASNNNWSGHLSHLFCNLSDLSVLDVSNNNISGIIPQCLGAFGTSLSVLDLRINKLHGTIPQSWNHGSSLRVIALCQNQLEGKIPRSLGNCTYLEFIDFGTNQIVDTFPSWLGSLPDLKILMLQSNRFYGEIQNPEGSSQFTKLRIIDISFNGFSGKLPSMYFQSWKYMESLDADQIMEYMEINQLKYFIYPNSDIGSYANSEIEYYGYSIKIKNKGMERIYSKIPNIFKAIDFSHNQFGGDIPTSIAKLKGLHLLNLGHNNLTGTIPSWLGDLHQLESLDLSHNKLSGKVPQEVTQRSCLSFFNVSYNNLSGIIPYGGQSDTFDNSSYIGNPGLLACHPTQPPTLTPKTWEGEEEEEEPVFDKIEWMMISMGCASGLVVGVVLGNELTVRKPLWFETLLGGWL